MIRKAVLPVAGMGTRVLPATKVLPKELLPVVDKPLIQYAVEEAAEAGITEIILVTAKGKEMLTDHFDRHPELERSLEERGKLELLDIARSTCPKGVTITTVRQPAPLGLGHAVLCARAAVGDEPFAVMLPDDLILGRPGCLKQLVDVWDQVGGHVIAVENVPADQVNRYGILDVIEEKGRLARARGMVEKPKPEDAPSTLSVIGRYILHPAVFDALELRQRGAGGEIQLTDGIARTLDRISLHGARFMGTRYDCGNKAGYVEAIIDAALAHPETAAQVLAHLEALLGRRAA
ncbi:UTP--glucose-1-phosphate uridylyltransferase [Paramagnetospirillum kuznetsovii]|uniref:UTP--glucose-1-phosphate uridylyltransferase n=1 Tax=Paramagnetospirillum kuznetsovii TaxID=2053833 RepID=A0A364P3W8_9PROT|nr:UTP--glucose-1-phosphate uridylyltransferase GalU [Paramagnetospirillum kuznetsovii]RAU24023.1 UTP--glucose-1-phosphate uridylyltransferase [Paramagnetospirillum kuznetsovii]